MGRVIKILATFAGSMLIVYLGIAFTVLELNPIEWAEPLRLIYSVIFIVSLIGFVLGITLDSEDKFTKKEVVDVAKGMNNVLIDTDFLSELRYELEKYAKEREEDDIQQV